ncbi:MAG TPA: hypothetical protein VFD27_13115, partial [Chthoniobacteraceae bacterium]|nr:hypothetical protein [Chthoniobacteraceae bacterium]
MNANDLTTNRERTITVHQGWTFLLLVILLLLGSIALFIYSIAAGVDRVGHPYWILFIVGVLGFPGSIIMLIGFFTLQPNEARVLVLFGDYKGTVRESGFHWGNP